MYNPMTLGYRLDHYYFFLFVFNYSAYIILWSIFALSLHLSVNTFPHSYIVFTVISTMVATLLSKERTESIQILLSCSMCVLLPVFCYCKSKSG